MRIHKSEPDIYIRFSPALHLQCVDEILYLCVSQISYRTVKMFSKFLVSILRTSAININCKTVCFSEIYAFWAVLRIHVILVWIQIRIQGAMPLLFSSLTFKTPTKTNFFCLHFLKVHLHNFSSIKSQKEVTKQ
jgi:hypothetical protein